MIVLKIMAWIILFNIVFFVSLYLWSDYQLKKTLTKNGHYDKEIEGDYDPCEELGI